jgi:hypothetical protein
MLLRQSHPFKPLRLNRLPKHRWLIKPKRTPKLWLTNNRPHWLILPLPSKLPTRLTRPPKPLKPQLSVVAAPTADSAEDMAVVVMEDARLVKQLPNLAYKDPSFSRMRFEMLNMFKVLYEDCRPIRISHIIVLVTLK